jgi:hypothetical protein
VLKANPAECAALARIARNSGSCFGRCPSQLDGGRNTHFKRTQAAAPSLLGAQCN